MNTPTDPLVNYGILRAHWTKPGDTVTVVVVGVPRSGTSMIAAVLKSLGVFIGHAVDNAVFEDRDIAAALPPGDSQRLLDLIAARNAAHRIWGFKRPEAYRHLDLLAASCRNLRVIVTFRDILAIALRNRIAMQMDPLKFLPRLVDDYRALAAALGNISVPCLLLSYEKCLQFPAATVEEIAAFCGLSPAEDQIAKAVSVIENGNSRYIQSARLKYDGSIDRLINDKLCGWVKVVNRDNVRVDVELHLDGRLVEKTRADQHRPDVQRAGFGDGRYGFAFSITADMNRDSIVEVKVQNSNIALRNSGLPLSQY